MDVNRTDFLLWFYHSAVVLSGAFLVRLFPFSNRFMTLGVAFVVALFWTAYFNWNIKYRMSELAKRSAD